MIWQARQPNPGSPEGLAFESEASKPVSPLVDWPAASLLGSDPIRRGERPTLKHMKCRNAALPRSDQRMRWAKTRTILRLQPSFRPYRAFRPTRRGNSRRRGRPLRNVRPATVSRPLRPPLAGVHPVKRRGRTLQLVESAATGFGRACGPFISVTYSCESSAVFKRLRYDNGETSWFQATHLQPGPKRRASMRTNWSQAPIETPCCKKPTKRNPQHDLMHGRGRRDRSRLRMRSEQRGQVMKERPFSGEHISGPEKVMLLVIAVGSLF
jgi:hypothetical protein